MCTKGLEGGESNTRQAFPGVMAPTTGQQGRQVLGYVYMPTGLVVVMNYRAHGLRVYVHHTEGCAVRV